MHAFLPSYSLIDILINTIRKRTRLCRVVLSYTRELILFPISSSRPLRAIRHVWSCPPFRCELVYRLPSSPKSTSGLAPHHPSLWYRRFLQLEEQKLCTCVEFVTCLALQLAHHLVRHFSRIDIRQRKRGCRTDRNCFGRIFPRPSI